VRKGYEMDQIGSNHEEGQLLNVRKSQLYDNHLADLKSSGLNDATIRDSGCFSATRHEVKAILGFDCGSSGLVFRYDSNGCSRVKPDVPMQSNGGRPGKYLTAKGKPNRLYIPPNLKPLALQDVSIDLIVTEGEKKGLCGNQYGFPTVSLPGVSCFVKRAESGESVPIPCLNLIEWKGRRTFIVYDSDASLKPEVRKASMRLRDELKSRSAAVFIVRLPEGPDGEKWGLDDFLLHEGPEALRERLKETCKGNYAEAADESWRPWWELGKSGRSFQPGILADIFAQTREAEENWAKWRQEGKPVSLARQDIECVTEGASVSYAGGDFWVYGPKAPGVWRALDREIIERWVTRIVKTNVVRASNVRGVMDLLRGLAYRNLSDFNADTSYLNVENGMLDLNTFELAPHRKGDLSTMQLEMPYDPLADCPRFCKFLDEVIIDEGGKPDIEAQRVVQEFAGYTLTTDTRHEKALLLLGEGSNGKSVLLRILEMIVGSRNVCSVPLEQMSNQFQLAELHGKLLNVAAEISARGSTPVNADMFKQLVSGDLIQASKKYHPPFNFHPTAKHIFAMNDLPRIYDTSHGFWRRILVVKFWRTFSEKEQQKDLHERLASEAPGILLWALAGLAALREQGRFTEARSVMLETDQFRQQSNPVSAFVGECCEVGDPEAQVSTSDLFNKYRSWADDNECKPVPSNWFGRHLGRHDERIRPFRNQGARGWEGICLTQ
jgi:putative DNA primase/helicase